MSVLYKTEALLVDENGTERMVNITFVNAGHSDEEVPRTPPAYRGHCGSCVHEKLCDAFADREGLDGSWVSEGYNDCDFYQEHDSDG